jgi:hypothetical protein
VKHALVLLALLTVAACSAGSSAAAAGKAKADYLAKAEVICTKANTQQAALKKPLSAADLAPYVHSLVSIADQSTTALLRLTPPQADGKELHAQLLDPLSTQLAKAKTFDAAVAKAVKAKDQVGLVKLLSDPPTKTVANLTWMRSYGFHACVDAADTSG